ncbi:MAG: NAD-dependent epimerase/dehydratase family protein [Coriobacteriia bacterium]|nr:NAD-dependent epimerase/dehydratase family protein [Coriobacteriia bacterium]
MRVLVTGGAGFIGSNLVHALITGRHEVGVIDDLSVGRAENLHPAAWFRRIDILDPGLSDLVAEFAPEAVVHLAAQADVQASIADPARDHAVNVDGTRAVAAAAAAAGVERVVSASSAAVYGEPAEVPLSETSSKRPMNPYGVSKLEAEAALAGALAGTGTDFASFRFANVYGPRQDGHGEGGVVAIFATKLAAGDRPVIYGTGRQTRDFIYVGDVVAAIIYALFADDPLAGPGPDGPAYNISTGRESSVEEIAGVLRMESMVLKEFERLPAREGDVERSALDPAKALEMFGWTANQGLESGLAMTWAYFRQSA